MSKEIISVAGAGGKTTFIQDLAKNISRHTDVLVSTTTKMKLPSKTDYDYLILKKEDFEKNRDYFLRYNDISVSDKIRYDMLSLKNKKLLNKKAAIYYYLKKVSINSENKKFMHIEDDDIEFFKNKFDYILLESDGAREKSLKFPKEYEPVISAYTTKTVVILDISMIGKILNEKSMYNYEEFIREITKNDIKSYENMKIDIELFYKLIVNKKGLFKNSIGEKILCVNKIRDNTDRENYIKLKDMLKYENIKVIRKKYYEF